MIWGVVGPKRMFSEGIYGATLWGFLWGPLLVLPFYFFSKRYPTSWVKNVHVPVLLSGPLYLAPYNFSYFWTGMPFAWFFNYWVKRRYVAWWSKYALTLTTALSVGLSLSALIIFFAVAYHPVTLDWWGNDVCKYLVVSFLLIPSCYLCPWNAPRARPLEPCGEESNIR